MSESTTVATAAAVERADARAAQATRGDLGRLLDQDAARCCAFFERNTSVNTAIATVVERLVQFSNVRRVPMDEVRADAILTRGGHIVIRFRRLAHPLAS